jgi:hypothetical protein
MSRRTLPERPSLENLQKQAKHLTKAYRAGASDAVARVAAVRGPCDKSPSECRLVCRNRPSIL